MMSIINFSNPLFHMKLALKQTEKIITVFVCDEAVINESIASV